MRIIVAGFAALCWAIAACALTTPARAEEQPSFGKLGGGVAFANERIWRGVSQTRGEPAVIGELKWRHAAGPFLGLWASNLSFDGGSDLHSEYVSFAGFQRKIGALDVETGYLHHHRPSRQLDWDFSELTVALGHDFGVASLRGGLFYSWDYYLGGRSVYSFLDLKAPAGSLRSMPIALLAHLGSYDFTDTRVDDYVDWKLGLILSVSRVQGVSISASYSATNIEPGKTILAGRERADGRFALVVTKVF